ncbi:MAG: hypothetical protein K0S75_70 [Clostridia bacterium]|jgi:hypothetical protein|nr:hypothetical protein [Clostridia bacterium]
MKNSNSNIKATGLLLVLILMLMLGLIYINNMNSISTSGTKDIKELSLIGQLEAREKNSIVCSVDDLLAEATGVVVKARNIKGEIIWSKTLISKVISMKSAASNLYVLDDSKKLYCISKSGNLIWDKQLEGEIKDIYADRNGAVLVDSKYNGGARIQIFSHKGIDVGAMTLDNAEVVAFASGKDENSISLIDISTQIVKTKIVTLNLRGDMVWSDNIDNQIVPMLGYTKDNTLIAIGENAIYKYEDKNKNQSKKELNKTIYSASISEEGAAIVVRSRKGFEVISYNDNLKELGFSELEQAPSGIILEKNNYILYYRENLLLVDLKGSINAEYKSIPAINKVYFTSEGSIISVSNRLIQKLECK